MNFLANLLLRILRETQDVGIRDGDQAFANHGLKFGQEWVDSFGAIDNLDANGQVFAQFKKSCGVEMPTGAIAFKTADGTGAGDAPLLAGLNDSRVERQPVPFVGAVDEYGHHLVIFFGRHGCHRLASR
jgi:hypothetical protein